MLGGNRKGPFRFDLSRAAIVQRWTLKFSGLFVRFRRTVVRLLQSLLAESSGSKFLFRRVAQEIQEAPLLVL